MARRSASSTSATAVALPVPNTGAFARVLQFMQTAFTWAFGITAIVCGIWGVVALEQLIINDKRFELAGPPEPGVESEHFTIAGARHASEQQITDLFLRDFGRSIYLCPIAERRRRLLSIDWVQDATVSRIWPNRLVVRIRERQPVAVVQVPGPDGTTLYNLVDADAVMLDPRRASRLALPVLNGILPTDKESVRRDRVKRFLRLQTELGSVMEHISEVDVTEPDNLRVVYAIEGRALTLMLGNQKFLERFQNFTDNYSEIKKRLGNATVLDLRLKDRITAVASEESE
ncbi:MAG: FtsQ-type POTRA domain-containing protein [Bryobacteraceae bacterium]|nr:FtsQ-type POTRA domain-containing protein [Bryobacteraceae bacterium]